MLSPTTSFSEKASGFLLWRQWVSLAIFEIVLHYRRSILGPFWLTLNMLILAAALAFVYGVIFKADLTSYFPYVTFGLLSWGIIAGLLTEASNTFISNAAVIKNTNTPLMFYVYKRVAKDFIGYFHHLLLIIPVYLIFPAPMSAKAFLFIPVLAILWINGICWGVLLGMLCSRFRDMPNIVSNLVSVFFLITPVFWPAESAGRPLLLQANPFYHYLQLMRAPLLGEMPTLANLVVVLTMTTLFVILAWLAFNRYRTRIVHTL